MRATIKMIAERAGVSIGTVDRVLHDRPYVKEEVRRRVLEVMEELDYQPNRVASALATSGMALAIVPETVVRMMNPVRIPRIYSIGKSGFHWNIGAIRREDAVLSGAQEQLIRLLRNRYL